MEKIYKILLGFDLALSAGWLIALLGSRNWHLLSIVITLYAIILRITLSFFLYRQERKSWIPLTVFWVCSIISLFVSCNNILFDGFLSGSWELKVYPYQILGIQVTRNSYMLNGYLLNAWLWILPTIMYFVVLWYKKLDNTTMSWKDGLGAILWHDKIARIYSKLILITIGALVSGLAMNGRMCLFACLSLPALGLYYLMKHYQIQTEKIWLLLIGMCLFFFAQSFGGTCRICMLAISLLLVIYICIKVFYCKMGLFSFSIFTSLYLGIILPSIAIGYNQYNCYEYEKFRPLESYRGIFMVKDPNTQKIGLRDRYGLLVNPEYEQICFATTTHWVGILELRKNGYSEIYNICTNSIAKSSDGIPYRNDGKE